MNILKEEDQSITPEQDHFFFLTRTASYTSEEPPGRSMVSEQPSKSSGLAAPVSASVAACPLPLPGQQPWLSVLGILEMQQYKAGRTNWLL